MDTYTIDVGDARCRYHQMDVPRGWRMLGAMRRAIMGLAVTMAIALSAANTAVADVGQVLRWNSTGPYAHAYWIMDDDFTDGATNSLVVSIGRTKNIAFLNVYQIAVHWIMTGCADGVCFYESTGFTETIASVTSGFTASFEQPLAGASVLALGVPASQCTRANDGIGSCTTVTVDVDVTWAGEGDITRGAQTEHFNYHGAVFNSRTTGASRNATATGAIAGIALPTSLGAGLATSSEGAMCHDVC